MRSLISWTLWCAVACACEPSFGQVVAGDRAVAPDRNVAPDRADFALLDRRTLAVAVFEIGEHWRGPEGADLEAISTAHPIIITADPESLADKAGISLRKVDRVLLTMGRGQLIYMATFYDAATLADFRKSQFPAGVEEAVGERKILLGGRNGRSAYELIDRMLVVGDAPEIREIAAGQGPAQTNPAMSAFRTVLGDKPLFALQVDAASIAPRLKAGAEAYGLVPLLDARAWRLVLQTTEGGLKISLSAQYDQPAQAAAGLEVLRKLQPTLVEYINLAALQTAGMLRDQAKVFPGGAVLAPAFEASVKRVRLAIARSTPRVDGGSLTLDCEVPTATPVVDAVFLMTLVPRTGTTPQPQPQPQPQP